MTPVTSDRCPLTPMRKALATLNLHAFLQLMEAPLVVSRINIYISAGSTLQFLLHIMIICIYAFVCFSSPVWSVRWPFVSPAPPVPLPADPPGLPLFSSCHRAPRPGHGHHSGLEAPWRRPAAACSQVCKSYRFTYKLNIQTQIVSGAIIKYHRVYWHCPCPIMSSSALWINHLSFYERIFQRSVSYKAIFL